MKPASLKALLLSRGEVYLPPGTPLPCPPSRSTAGPHAGQGSLVLSLEGFRVKLSLTREPTSELALVPDGGPFIYDLMRKGRPFVEGVHVEPVKYHAPGQAFLNIEPSCRFGCAFCTLPARNALRRYITSENIVRTALKAVREGARAVALTGGVTVNPERSIAFMAKITGRIRDSLDDAGFGEVPVGVEPYATTREAVESLRGAGVEEIKLNLQSSDRGIFRRACPRLDREGILRAIGAAGEVFGRGKVTSNLIVGMGESDGSVTDAVETLAGMGCVATLRPLRVNATNRARLAGVIQNPKSKIQNFHSPSRLLRLAEAHRRILAGHGLGPDGMRTMCHPCGACDLVPFRDV